MAIHFKLFKFIANKWKANKKQKKTKTTWIAWHGISPSIDIKNKEALQRRENEREKNVLTNQSVLNLQKRRRFEMGWKLMYGEVHHEMACSYKCYSNNYCPHIVVVSHRKTTTTTKTLGFLGGMQHTNGGRVGYEGWLW